MRLVKIKIKIENTNSLLGSPISRHKVGPNTITCVIEFHKWNIIPMGVEIGTGYLLTEN